MSFLRPAELKAIRVKKRDGNSTMRLPSDLDAFVEGRDLPHVILHLPPGYDVGPLLQEIVRRLYPDPSIRSDNVLSLDALQARGIEFVRDKIKAFVLRRAVQKNASDTSWKIVLLHHADLLTWEAQCALRRVLESNVRSTRFVWMVSDAERLIDPIRSRCWYTKIRADDALQQDLEDVSWLPIGISQGLKRALQGLQEGRRQDILSSYSVVKDTEDVSTSVERENRARAMLLLPPKGFWVRWLQHTNAREAWLDLVKQDAVPRTWLEDLMRTMDPNGVPSNHRDAIRGAYEEAIVGISRELIWARLSNHLFDA
jgi:hypothetical protein